VGVDVMRPAFNFEPKYRFTMLPMEDWTKGTDTPTAVKGFFWFTDEEGDRSLSLWAISGKKAQFFSRKICHNLSG